MTERSLQSMQSNADIKYRETLVNSSTYITRCSQQYYNDKCVNQQTCMDRR